MKKILIVTFALLLSATPALADNDDAAYLLGGIAGGLFLGEVLQNNRNPVYQNNYYENAPPQYYEEGPPPPVQRCVVKYKSYYDYMGNWVRRPVRKCYWAD